MRRVLGPLLVMAVALAVAASALGSAPPKHVRNSIVAAALAQKSVHWTSTYTADQYGRESYTTYVNANSGRQTLTSPGCYLGAPRGSVRLRLVHHTVYVNGNVCGLVYALKLSQARAETYAGHWISVPRRAKPKGLYRRMADGLTLASVVRDVAIWPAYLKLRSSSQRSHGKRFVVLRGTSASQSTCTWELRARGAGEPLPVAFSTGVPSQWSVTHFSKWNKPVHVRAPAHSISITTVRGS
jgi:hypothetical protein